MINKKRKIIIYYLIFILSFIINLSTIKAQDEKYKIRFHGGLGLNGIYNTSFSETQRLIPWSYGISGNLRMSIGKLNIPVSLFYSQNGLGLNHNFNRIGISPSYKIIKFHLGYRSMTFSPYVLNGNTFLGVGLEFKYRWIRIAVMKGKLRNLMSFSIEKPILGLESLKDYNRDVITFKLGFGSESNYFDLIFFKGKDKISKIFGGEQRPDIDYKYFPKENLALGFNTRFSIKNVFFFSANLMASAYSENSVSQSIDLGDFDFLNSIYKPNVTTQIGFAGKANVSIKIRMFNIGTSYERITPQFETIGRYYNLNDTERKRLTLAFRLKFISLNSSYGIEKNDLASTNMNSNIRNIFSINAITKISKKFRLRATFSNFNIDNTPSIIDDNDTLKVARVLTNALFAPQYSFGNSTKQSIRIVGMYRTVDNKFAFRNENNSIKIYRARLNYSIKFIDSKLNLGINASYQVYNYTRINKNNYTFGLFVSKALLENRIRTRINSSYAITNVVGKSNGFGLHNDLSVSYLPFKHHSLNLGLTYFHRNRYVGDNTSEFRSRLSYQFTF